MRVNETYTKASTLAEINVTPMVDVMLVLLIIFMISAPLMQQGIQVNLPKTKSEALSETSKQLTIVVDKNRRILINKKRIKRGTLRKRLIAIASVTPDMPVFIQADAELNYGFVARVIAEIKKANLHRVGLVTQPASKEKPL